MITTTKTMKTLAAAFITSGLMLSAAAPVVAQARPYTQTYSCQATKSKSQKTGAIVGAIGGAVVGSQVAKHEKGLGAVVGGLAGAAIGSKVGKDQGKQQCNNVENAMQDAGYGHHVVRHHRHHVRKLVHR
jgi:phage tail tape-measure protein